VVPCRPAVTLALNDEDPASFSSAVESPQPVWQRVITAPPAEALTDEGHPRAERGEEAVGVVVRNRDARSSGVPAPDLLEQFDRQVLRGRESLESQPIGERRRRGLGVTCGRDGTPSRRSNVGRMEIPLGELECRKDLGARTAGETVGEDAPVIGERDAQARVGVVVRRAARRPTFRAPRDAVQPIQK
jgi:hypothetical protein